jgi:hypothetical protein
MSLISPLLLSAVMLSVVMLSVVMLNVVMLSVVAPMSVIKPGAKTQNFWWSPKYRGLNG